MDSIDKLQWLLKLERFEQQWGWSVAEQEQASPAKSGRLLKLNSSLVRSSSTFIGAVDQPGTSQVDPAFEAALVSVDRTSEFSLVSQAEAA